MVACNLTFREAAAFVRLSRPVSDTLERFRLFVELLELREPAALKLFGKACGIRVACVEVPAEALDDPDHPLHFLTKESPAP